MKQPEKKLGGFLGIILERERPTERWDLFGFECNDINFF